MVGKKKVSGQKEISQAETGEEGKENREKGGEKDAARRRGGPPRKGRGASRGRECEFIHSFVFLFFFYMKKKGLYAVFWNHIFKLTPVCLNYFISNSAGKI